MKSKKEKFHYCIELEDALNELFGQGKKWDGMAGAFHDVKIVKEALQDSIRKIQTSLDNMLTADDRLLLTTSLTLRDLKREIKCLGEESNNELEIIAHLLHFIITLLGFDWQLGEPNRQIFYFQTTKQKAVDDAKLNPSKFYPSGKLEYDKRFEIVNQLYDDGFRISQIARIMKLSEYLVKDFLVRAQKIKRNNKH